MNTWGMAALELRMTIRRSDADNSHCRINRNRSYDLSPDLC